MADIDFIVAVPTYNRAHLLPRVISSLTVQKYHNWRVLFFDDCSQDNTESVVRGYTEKYPEKVLYRRMDINSGVNAVRNSIINECQNLYPDSYIVWIDDDDFLSENCLELAKESIANHSSYVWFTLDCVCSKGRQLSRLKKYGKMNYLDDYMFSKSMRGDMTHIVLASAISDVRFSDKFRNAEEWFFWSNLSAKNDIYAIESVGSVKEYMEGGLTDTGHNREKKVQVLRYKIETLSSLVDERKLLHQYVSLAKHLLRDRQLVEARYWLNKARTVNPIYFRQYKYWLSLFLQERRSI